MDGGADCNTKDGLDSYAANFCAAFPCTWLPRGAHAACLNAGIRTLQRTNEKKTKQNKTALFRRPHAHWSGTCRSRCASLCRVAVLSGAPRNAVRLALRFALSNRRMPTMASLQRVRLIADKRSSSSPRCASRCAFSWIDLNKYARRTCVDTPPRDVSATKMRCTYVCVPEII